MLTRTKKSTLFIQEGPGPNKYDTLQANVLPDKPKYSVKRELRAIGGMIKKNNQPGPASYNQFSIKKKCQNILFNKASRSMFANTSTNTPGVGSYNLRTNLLSSKIIKNSSGLKRIRKMF